MAGATDHIRPLIDLDERERRTIAWPPQDGWFSARGVTYIKDFIQMIFFGLALPYLISRFFSDPFRTIRVVGQAQVGT